VNATFRTIMISSREGIQGDGWAAPADLRRLVDEDRAADVLALHRALAVTVLDSAYLAQVPGAWGWLLGRLPFRLAQIVELVRVRHDFDIVLTWGERDAVRVGALLSLLRRRPAHMTVLFWISDWRKALPLALARRGLDRLVIAAPLQLRFAVERLRLPRKKVVSIPWSVDARFWRPMPVDPAENGDGICSVGLEMRDYETLLRALEPLAIPCHIAAASRRTAPKALPHDLELNDRSALVTVGAKSQEQLRALYARSRFVVVPLLPSDSDNGITTCLEAMAMGKALICTETAGQVGVLEAGVNSIRVPPGDEIALRCAIERLWTDPDLCSRLGAAGRALVESRYSDEIVLPRLVALCEETIAERRRPKRRN
jgi:glycosyltransferase involved in cell wall biosynthesis